jgi:hypothetical protein
MVLTQHDLGGHRILRRNNLDGHIHDSGSQEGCDRFIRNFQWSAVKNYTITVTVEQEIRSDYAWDEEVELYDIRGTQPRSLPTVSTLTYPRLDRYGGLQGTRQVPPTRQAERVSRVLLL